MLDGCTVTCHKLSDGADRNTQKAVAEVGFCRGACVSLLHVASVGRAAL